MNLRYAIKHFVVRELSIARDELKVDLARIPTPDTSGERPRLERNIRDLEEAIAHLERVE